MWRRRERDQRDPSEEFGGPLFPDEDPDRRHRASDDTGERRLSFGPNDTGPLPHWTDPPTGEIPRMAPAAAVRATTTTTTSTCGRRSPPSRRSGATTSTRTRRRIRAAASARPERRGSTATRPARCAPTRCPSRCRGRRRARSRSPRRRAASPAASRSAPTRPASSAARRPVAAAAAPPSQTALGPPRRPGPHVGRAGARRRATCRPRSSPALVLAALFIARHAVAAGRPCVALDRRSCSPIAGFEYFGKVTEKGYRPAVAPGLAACVAAPLAAYWVGDDGAPARRRVRLHRRRRSGSSAPPASSPGPLPNMAITTMGVVWIGLLGSFAALILRWSNARRRATTSAPTRCS